MTVLYLTTKNFSPAQRNMVERLMTRADVETGSVFYVNMHNSIKNLWVRKGKTKNTFIPNEAMESEFHKKLKDFINRIKPKLIVVNDQACLGFITNYKYTSLDLCRGSVYMYNEIPTLVIDDVLKTKTVKYYSWLMLMDFSKMRRWQNDTQRREPKFAYTVCRNRSDIDIFRAYAQNSKFISIDIETNSRLITSVAYTCISGTGSIHTYVVPFFCSLNEGNVYWQNEADEVYAWKAVREVNANDAIKIFQNGSYDNTYFIIYNCPVKNFFLDTAHLFHSTWCEAPKKINFIASIMLDHCRYWKDELKGSKDDPLPKTEAGWNQYWRYNGLDTHNTALCAFVMLELLTMEKSKWALDNYTKQEFPLQFGPAMLGSLHGFYINNDRLEFKARQWLSEHHKALDDLRTMCDDKEFNPNSPHQTASLIYDVLGARPIKARGKHAKSERSTDEKILKLIRIQHPVFAKYIDQIWATKKPLNNYAKYGRMILIDGKWYYSLGAAGTETGRFNSSKFLIAYGQQAQNVPEEVREVIVAPPGYVICDLDYSQSDTWFVAYETEDENMIKVCNDERDTHCVHAEYFFRRPYEDIFKGYKNKERWVVHSTEGVRQNTKRLAHGANYRMSGYTCYMTLGHEASVATLQQLGFKNAHLMDVRDIVAQIQKLLDGYTNDLYPKLAESFKTLPKEIAKNGNLATCAFGRTRLFFGNILEDEAIQREASAYFGQGGTAGNVNRVLLHYYYVDRSLFNEGVLFVVQVHDSLVFLIPEDKLQLIKNILTIMEMPVTIKGRTFSVPADAKVGYTWGQEKSTMVQWHDGLTLEELKLQEEKVRARYV